MKGIIGKSFHRAYILIGGVLLILGGWFYFCLPDPLFQDPYSTILKDQNEQLLGARIAADGQWRFPYPNELPPEFVLAITTFEDKRFFAHQGVDPFAMLRAIYLNLTQGEVVSGGSTLTMQVIRLARKGKSRTIWEKVIEVIWATRLELSYSKEEILSLYASHAPFGGNVVGLDAAAWKYYGRNARQLSWAEMATLAVLPNAPALIHPGRNRDVLQRKRDRLLQRLLEVGFMDTTTCVLAQQEPLPQRPLPLPSHAPHLLERIHQQQLKQPRPTLHTISTLDVTLQKRVNQLVNRHVSYWEDNGIHNAAALVIEVETGDIKAYVGNASYSNDSKEHGRAVDIITAARSSGSILKPFLYASMLQDGELLPDMLVPDIPSYYQGYTPVNYNQTYAGAVPAHRALARSLNIPAVRMLNDHGIAKFQEVLRQLGMRTLHRSPDGYGLTLILGGAESSLWDLGAMYSGMARSLKLFSDYHGQYAPDHFRPLNFWQHQSRGILPEAQWNRLQGHNPLTAASIWHTFESMVHVTRPNVDRFWQRFSSSHMIAWKTGTSFGSRDAWAVGCRPEYIVAVWMGNADGEGRAGLTGASAAAPLMLDIFNVLPLTRAWFEPPTSEMTETEVCVESGHLASAICPAKHLAEIPTSGMRTRPCPYHIAIHLDPTQQYRVHSECLSPQEMIRTAWFVLPPVQEHYYQRFHPNYLSLPPYRQDCYESLAATEQVASMELVYPRHSARIYVPVELDGSHGRTVFELTHRNPGSRVYWHLDNTYLGYTEDFHEMGLTPKPGMHTLTWVDEHGAVLKKRFEILAKEE